MKKVIIILAVIAIVVVNIGVEVYAGNLKSNQESVTEFNDALKGILDTINENDFASLTQILNDFFGVNLSLKDRLLAFITGDIGVNFNALKSFILGKITFAFSVVLKIIGYVVFIAVIHHIANTIILKTNGNNEKYAIYFICYFVIITLFSKLVLDVFSTVTETVQNMNKVIELSFPTMIVLSEFSGGFGTVVFKPIASIITVIISALTTSWFLPILSTCAVSILISNISQTIKLNSLVKTLLGFVKWTLGIVTIILGVILLSQGIVNSQYNGLSFKILKYTTGSMIPIVGGFISGGLDVLLSSAVLVKNSFGLMIVLYVLLYVGGSALTLLIISFILKFIISLCEPIIDEKIVGVSVGVCNVISHASAVVFVSGFLVVLVCFSLINTTALII